ncbi:hypothetical protein K439DRAFT_1624228 [Ramaria rubella]|nr:hypothetical protein K439DRAFT_1624228 [Ramaria rubella]
MDDLISVTCHLTQNFASQGWATKEGMSKSQIPLQDVLGVMYGSVDVFSRHTVTWEPVSTEEGNLDHPPGTSRPDVHTSATQGMVKPDRATANHAPGALGKDEALWELMYFFDNMDNPTGAPCKETGDPRFTQQHLVATFMDLILFAHGMAAPQAHLPSRGYEALALSLMGIAEKGYVWQNMPYGIDFTGDIGVYRRSGMFWSWGKAQRGAWFAALCHDDPDRRLGLVCVRAGEPRPAHMTQPTCAGHPALMQEFPAFSRFVCAIPVKECLCLRHLGHMDNHFRSKMIDPTLFQLFQAAGFPTRAGLAADLGIWAYITDPQPPSPACTTAGEAHASPRSVVGALCWHVNPPEEGPYFPPTGPSSARHPARDTVPLWLPMGWPNVRIPDVPDSLLSSPAPTPRLRPTWERTCVVELPPPRHARSLFLARHLSKRARSASKGPPGEDAQAVCLSEPHPIAGGRPTPPFDTLDSVLLHVVQGTRVRGHPPAWDAGAAPRFPWGCHALVFACGSDVAHPMGFQPPGRRRPSLAAPVGAHPDIMGSDHRGTIVNMYLELSRTEWWALSDQCEVLSEWCKGASMPV